MTDRVNVPNPGMFPIAVDILDDIEDWYEVVDGKVQIPFCFDLTPVGDDLILTFAELGASDATKGSLDLIIEGVNAINSGVKEMPNLLVSAFAGFDKLGNEISYQADLMVAMAANIFSGKEERLRIEKELSDELERQNAIVDQSALSIIAANEARNQGGASGGIDEAGKGTKVEKTAEENALLLEQQMVADALALNALIDQEAAKNEAKLEAQHQERTATALHQLQLEKMEADSQKKKKAIMMSGLGNLASLMSSGSKRLFEIGKTAALSQAVIDGYAAITGAYKHGASAGGPWLGAAYAATAALTTASQIQSIRSQSFGGGGTPAAASGGAPPTGQQPADTSLFAPTETTDDKSSTITNVFLEGGIQSTESVIQLIKQINELAGDGMEVRATVLT